MKIEIWLTGKTKDNWAVLGMEEYLKRCRRYGSIETIIIPESRHDKPEVIVKDESERILAQLRKNPRVYTILLDEKGDALSSPAFAQVLSQQFVQGHSTIRFIIGGAYGVSASVKREADMVLSLSLMTFPHQLVRVLFAEQLYRAFTILRRESYHHE